MCGQSLVCFGSSVIYINGVHFTTVRIIACGGGAIISFDFSFDVAVVSNIADIIINIDININIADRGWKRCRNVCPEGVRTTICGKPN